MTQEGGSHGTGTVCGPVKRGRTRPAGTIDSRGNEPSAKGCPGPYSAEGGRGLGDRAHRGGAGHIGGYGVPYQAAVPGGRPEAGLGRRSPARTASQTGSAGGSASDRPGLQPGSPGPRPLDPEAPGKQGGGVGVGALHVPRGDSQAVEKTVSSRGRRKSGVSPR